MNKKIMTGSLSLIALAMSLVGCSSTTSSGTATSSEEAKTSTKADFDTTKAIKFYTRDTTSGTRDGFFTKIGMGSAKSDDSKLGAGFITVNSNGDMVNSIKNDEYGIGYISLSSLESSTLIGLKYDGVNPSEANVLNNTYQLTRNFNYVTRNDYAADSKVKQIVEAFTAYMGTTEGKAIIKANDGIISLSASDKSWNDIKNTYPIINEDNKNITVYFGGSTSCEKIAKALTSAFSPLCGNFIANHNHTGSGDAFKHTQATATKDDATGKLDVGFLSRELESNEPAAEGTFGKICTDAIVAVVNSKNTYRETDAETLKAIYQGTKKTWNQVIVA